MSQIEDYNSQLTSMKALAAADVKIPTIPVDHAIQEAENLHPVSIKYKDNFIAVGFPEENFDVLQARTGALREAQSRWIVNYNAQQDAIKEWDEKSPEAFELQRKLNQIFRYAYRKEKRLLGRVKEIAKGSGNYDLIQDLNDYATLGKSNPEPLQKINTDLSILDKSSETANTLGDLLALANGDRNEQHELKNLRDRAYTILKETVDEIRDCGKFVFADEPDIRKLFASAYNRKRNVKHEETQEEIVN